MLSAQARAPFVHNHGLGVFLFSDFTGTQPTIVIIDIGQVQFGDQM